MQASRRALSTWQRLLLLLLAVGGFALIGYWSVVAEGHATRCDLRVVGPRGEHRNCAPPPGRDGAYRVAARRCALSASACTQELPRRLARARSPGLHELAGRSPVSERAVGHCHRLAGEAMNADRLPDCRPPRRDESLMSASSHPELLSGYLAMRPHSGVLRRRAERGLRNRWSRHAPAAAVLVLAAVFVFKQGSRALGLTVPLALLGRADEVIE
jgi:hypothetical protein